MRFSVVWAPGAVDELARIWVDSRDRGAVSAAADRLDAELTVDADFKGQPFAQQRMIFEHPIALIYTVYRDVGVVRVEQAIAIPPQNGQLLSRPRR